MGQLCCKEFAERERENLQRELEAVPTFEEVPRDRDALVCQICLSRIPLGARNWSVGSCSNGNPLQGHFQGASSFRRTSASSTVS